MRTLKLGISVFAIAALGLAFTNSSVLKDSLSTSGIKWTGKKVTGQHEGTVDFKEMNIKLDEAGALESADFVVDMGSIKVTDLEGESAMKLQGHLSSADFFDVENHPTSSFKATSIKSLGKGRYSVTGDMTIKDITESITFEAIARKSDGKIHATADVKVDRSKFDVKYGSGSFFDGLGDKMIYDDFELKISIVK